MQLTPADIHNTVFGKSPLGKRGYDEEEVDALLDEATQEMIRLLEENELLRQRADVAGAAADDGRRANDNALESELSAAGAELNRVRRACDAAERKAFALRDQLNKARREAAAEPPAAEPTKDPHRVLALAQRTADDHLRDAKEQSDSLINEAREQSDKVIRDARSTVSTIESEAKRHHTDAIAALQAKRTAMLREIEGLTHMAHDYQSALQDHILHQQELLTGIPQETS